MKIAVNTILAIILSFLGSNVCYAQEHKLDSVRVEFEGFNTETFFDVSCEAFNSTFKDTKKTEVFQDKQDLFKFKVLTHGFIPHTKTRFLDVRGIIVYSYGKTGTKYCFDVFGIFIKTARCIITKSY